MGQSIQQWFKSKGGLAHVLAAGYLFLLAAYGAVPAFHQFAQRVNQSLPGWAEELAAAIVGLAAFYKTWQATAASPEAQKPQ